MPELPEVETMRRGILAVVGRRIAAVERPPSRKRPIVISPPFATLRRRLLGRRIEAVERLGKRVVLRLGDARRLVIEPRMTGLVLLADPPTREHLRLRLALEPAARGSRRGPAELLFWDRRGLGVVRLVDPAELAERYGRESLGPDALEITVAELRERLGASRRAIKVALLDQKALAGVGNLYASELLHAAGIDPRRRCRALGRAEWERIHAALRQVLEAAIRYEGSTLSDGTYRNALNGEGGYQQHHRVYDRAGRLCSTCRAANVVRIVQAQRSTFYCPACQSGRRAPPGRPGRR